MIQRRFGSVLEDAKEGYVVLDTHGPTKITTLRIAYNLIIVMYMWPRGGVCNMNTRRMLRLFIQATSLCGRASGA